MIELKSVLEALVFASQNPLSVGDLKALLSRAAEDAEAPETRTFRKTKVEEIDAALRSLRDEYEAAGRSFRLVCVADAWHFVALPDFAAWLRVLAGERARPAKLSQPALETLTIIAYRQPITRAEIEQIRGVSVDGVMQTLLERGLVEQVGRAEVVGRPATYGTTRQFLEYFGLARVEDLPGGDELRRIPVERPPALLTVEPGLATVPPEQLTLEAAAADTEAATSPATTTEPASARGAELPASPPETADLPETAEDRPAPPAPP
jgi:segregation and condensation protein B